MIVSKMHALVDNKHYFLAVETDSFYMGEDDKLNLEYSLTLKSTRATKFQGKKLLKRKLMSALRRGIIDERSGNSKNN